MQIPSLLTSSKFKPSMTSGWVQNLLLSLDTLGKTVSTKILQMCNRRRKRMNLGAWKLEFPGQEVGRWYTGTRISKKSSWLYSMRSHIPVHLVETHFCLHIQKTCTKTKWTFNWNKVQHFIRLIEVLYWSQAEKFVSRIEPRSPTWQAGILTTNTILYHTPSLNCLQIIYILYLGPLLGNNTI